MGEPFKHSDLTPAIIRHFDSLKNQHIEIPEWLLDGGEPTVVFFDPLNVQERIDLDEDADDYLVQVIILKAKKPDGSKMFTLADHPTLMLKASPWVVSRLANRILNADTIDPKLLGESSPTGEKRDASSG